MAGLFVTSSGTGIGKTLVTAALAYQLRQAGRRVAALKPITTGFDPAAAAACDAAVLLAALGRPVTEDALAACSPWRFAAALSPAMAAARDGRVLELTDIVACCRAAESRAELLLVEGIGGAMVPLNRRHTVLDWIAALGYPAVLVVGSYLGSLSHSLTAAAALRHRGVRLAAAIVSETAESSVALADTVASLADFLAPSPVIALPLVAGPRPWQHAPPLYFGDVFRGQYT